MEQRVNLKFLVKLGKNATECFQMLKNVYGDECLSRTQVFLWHKRFLEGRESVEDDPRPGRPVTASTDENVKKIEQIVRIDRRLSIRMIAEMTNCRKETVRQILGENLNMSKVCAKLVPKNLTADQKLKRFQDCSDTVERLKDDPDLLNRVITCDETWIFQYDPETKWQSMHWKTPFSPPNEKSSHVKIKIQGNVDGFF